MYELLLFVIGYVLVHGHYNGSVCKRERERKMERLGTHPARPFLGAQPFPSSRWPRRWLPLPSLWPLPTPASQAHDMGLKHGVDIYGLRVPCGKAQEKASCSSSTL